MTAGHDGYSSRNGRAGWYVAGVGIPLSVVASVLVSAGGLKSDVARAVQDVGKAFAQIEEVKCDVSENHTDVQRSIAERKSQFDELSRRMCCVEDGVKSILDRMMALQIDVRTLTVRAKKGEA